MTVRRGLLNAGVFLAAVGAVALLVETGVVSAAVVADALRFWPLAVIAIGIGILLRRTQLGVPGGALAAAVPGLLLGGAIVSVPEIGSFCGNAEPGAFDTQAGAFGESGSVDLRLACGEMTVTTQPGSTWKLETSSTSGSTPAVNESIDALSVASATRRKISGVKDVGDDWRLVLPTASDIDLRAEIDAGKGRLSLTNAKLSNVRLSVNAGEAVLDLTGSTLPELDVEVNAGSASVLLPSRNEMTGTISTNAGSLKLCAPSDLALRISGNDAIDSVTVRGLIRNGDSWETSNYESAVFHADLSVDTSLGSVNVNPEGGCL